MAVDNTTREKQLREIQLDIVYVYPRASREKAQEIFNQIQNTVLKARLFDDEKPFGEWRIGNKLERQADLFQRTTVCLFHVDDNIGTDKDWQRARNENIENKEKECIPVWSTPKTKLNDAANDALYGLRSLIGFDPSKHNFTEQLSSIFNDQKHSERKQTREKIQTEKHQLFLEELKNVLFGLDKQNRIERKFAAEKPGGIDLLGHEKYAEKFAEIIITNPEWETPSTVGILAPWGSGKSFFAQRIKDHVTKNKTDLKLRHTGMNCCLCNIPALLKQFIYFFVAILLMAISFFPIVIISTESGSKHKSKIETKITLSNQTSFDQSLDDQSDTKIQAWYFIFITPCLVLALVILLGICERKVSKCLSKCSRKDDKQTEDNTCEGCVSCYFCFLKPPTSDEKDVKVKVIVVEFNAWLYSGCDVLWAGIVKELGSKIEDYFGKKTVRYMRFLLKTTDNDNIEVKETTQNSEQWRFKSVKCCKLQQKNIVIFLMKVYFTVYLLGLSLFAAFYFGAISAMTGKVATICMISGSTVIAIIKWAYIFTRSTDKVVRSQLKKKAQFQGELGFMHEIKEEVILITRIIDFMSSIYGCKFRVLLIIDDLDRCKQDRIMGVLEAMNLLLDHKNSPFISLLTIDPRIVLGAIERHFHPNGEKDFAYAYVNGYEYLKKIVHVPFCLPRSTKKEKGKFLEHLFRRPLAANKEGRCGTETDVVQSHMQDDDNSQMSNKGIDASTSKIAVIKKKKGEGRGILCSCCCNQDSKNERYARVRYTASPSNPGIEEGVKIDIPEEQVSGEQSNHSEPAVVQPQQENDVNPPQSNQERTEETLVRIEEILSGEEFSELLDCNPRTLKRVFNVLLFSLHLYRGGRSPTGEEKTFAKVIIMVEQWPFRTSLLKILSDREDEKVETLLTTLWEDRERIVRKNEQWKRFVHLDSDYTRFEKIIKDLSTSDLRHYLDCAVNYDHDFENIIKKGSEPNA